MNRSEEFVIGSTDLGEESEKTITKSFLISWHKADQIIRSYGSLTSAGKADAERIDENDIFGLCKPPDQKVYHRSGHRRATHQSLAENLVAEPAQYVSAQHTACKNERKCQRLIGAAEMKIRPISGDEHHWDIGDKGK